MKKQGELAYKIQSISFFYFFREYKVKPDWSLQASCPFVFPFFFLQVFINRTIIPYIYCTFHWHLNIYHYFHFWIETVMMSGKIINYDRDHCLSWKNTLWLRHKSHKTFCFANTFKPTQQNDKDVCQAKHQMVLSPSFLIKGNCKTDVHQNGRLIIRVQ